MTLEEIKTIDKYKVIQNLGRGAKSTIWKVEDPEVGKIYTLKRVIRESEEDDRFLEQARIEHEVCTLVDHEYLRKTYELKKIRNWFKTQEIHLLMEYFEGKTIKQDIPSDIIRAIDVFTRVCDGLDAMHKMGYVHADIKPKNILISDDGNIKIIDFGQSCPIGHRKKRIQGTPDYMAPEQVKRKILDQRTDVFNVGASLYWVLTGQNYPATVSKDNSDLSVAPVQDVPPPDQLNAEVPRALSNLVMDCCQRDMRKRPENMGEVIARLDVAKHIYLRQKYPDKYAKKNGESKPDKSDKKDKSYKPISADDTAEFERFLEDIL